MIMGNLAWQKNVNDEGEFNVLSKGKKKTVFYFAVTLKYLSFL